MQTSLATWTKKAEMAYAISAFFFLGGETRKIKCGVDERRRRGLDRADPLSAPIGADANESRHADHMKWFRLSNFLWKGGIFMQKQQYSYANL